MMYSSQYGNAGSSTLGKQSRLGDGSQRGRVRSKISAVSDPLSITGLEVNVRPLLDYGAKLLNGKLTVSENS